MTVWNTDDGLTCIPHRCVVRHEVRDRRALDLGQALAAVALKHLHALVELCTREIEIRLHAQSERSVLLVVALPELADHPKAGASSSFMCRFITSHPVGDSLMSRSSRKTP